VCVEEWEAEDEMSLASGQFAVLIDRHSLLRQLIIWSDPRLVRPIPSPPFSRVPGRTLITPDLQFNGLRVLIAVQIHVLIAKYVRSGPSRVLGAELTGRTEHIILFVLWLLLVTVTVNVLSSSSFEH
jgi:hypothetical protein